MRFFDRHGREVRITSDGRVKVYDKTYTSNKHQPAAKWYQIARPRDPQAYAAKKIASGEWTEQT